MKGSVNRDVKGEGVPKRALRIREDRLTGRKVADLLREHLKEMYEITPAQSVHALDLKALRAPGITFWSAWEGRELVGCGALKELDETHAEIKSMRTAPAHRGKGVASRVLAHLVGEAQRRGYQRLSLETGSPREFIAARALYERFGFEYCEPFADYTVDPNSVYMTRRLDHVKPGRGIHTKSRK